MHSCGPLHLLIAFSASGQHEAGGASHAGFDAKAEILQLGADFEAVVADADQKRDRRVRRRNGES